jgi:hypothetical protein
MELTTRCNEFVIEKSVFKTVEGEKYVLLVAHKIYTLKNGCDCFHTSHKDIFHTKFV